MHPIPSREKLAIIWEFFYAIHCRSVPFESTSSIRIHKVLPTLSFYKSMNGPNYHAMTDAVVAKKYKTLIKAHIKKIWSDESGAAATEENIKVVVEENWRKMKESRHTTVAQTESLSNLIGLLHKHFQDALQDKLETVVHQRLYWATILTPRTKNNKFGREEDYAESMKLLKKKVAFIQKLQSHTTQDEEKKTLEEEEPVYDSDDLLQITEVEPTTLPTASVNELDAYLNSTHSSIELKSSYANPMKYWLDNKDKFPAVYKVARNVFVTLTSSAASESLFSIASNFYTNKRLSLKVCDEMLFIKAMLDSDTAFV